MYTVSFIKNHITNTTQLYKFIIICKFIILAIYNSLQKIQIGSFKMLEFIKRWYHHNLSSQAAGILILQFITIFIIIYYFSNIFGPIIAAFVLAFMLDRPTSYLVKKGASRLSASAILISAVIVSIVAILCIVTPPVINQLNKVSSNLVTSLNELTDASTIDKKMHNIAIFSTTHSSITYEPKNNQTLSNQISDNNIENNPTIQNLTEDQNFNSSTTEEIAPGKQTVIEKTNKTKKWLSETLNSLKNNIPEAYHNVFSEENVSHIIVSCSEYVKERVSPLITTQIPTLLMNTLSVLVYLLIVPIFSFLMLKDKDNLLQIFRKYFSSNTEVSTFWCEVNHQITQYINGKCIHVVIISLINGAAFALFGVNYALLLGIGVGLSVIIPYVGMILITVPLIAIGLMQYGLSSDLAWLLVIYTIIQLIDAYVITPMLFSGALNLNSLAILISITIFGSIWGMWGVILALPLAAIIKTILSLWPTR